MLPLKFTETSDEYKILNRVRVRYGIVWKSTVGDAIFDKYGITMAFGYDFNGVFCCTVSGSPEDIVFMLLSESND